jgi:predicted ester cyclase
MLHIKENKDIIVRILSGLGASKGSKVNNEECIQDPLLVAHFEQLESLFQQYKFLIDEITAEADRVVVRGRFQIEDLEGLLNQNYNERKLEIPTIYGFRIAKARITEYWMMTDQHLFST